MKAWQKINSSTNLGLPIDMEKGRDFTEVHGIDRAVGNGPSPSRWRWPAATARSGARRCSRGGFGRGGGGEEREGTGGK
jgi:hypothetical protein